ncbi:MAG: hypothetical protein C4289_14690, partial [Chloroflexota bacterium]
MEASTAFPREHRAAALSAEQAASARSGLHRPGRSVLTMLWPAAVSRGRMLVWLLVGVTGLLALAWAAVILLLEEVQFAVVAPEALAGVEAAS